MRRLPVILLLAAALPWAAGADTAEQAWGYHTGKAYPPRQGNFCDRDEDAMEVADIFERFGARTGFSALSNSPGCSTRVHAVTPRKLLRRVRVALQIGGGYAVNFIRVETEDGSTPVLVTTRQLFED